jgi:hypothetical protein
VPSQAAGTGPGLVGEDLREVVDDGTGRAALAVVELGADDVHPALDETADVGEVDLLLLGLVAQHTDVGERRFDEAREVVLGEHAVDPAGACGCVAWRSVGAHGRSSHCSGDPYLPIVSDSPPDWSDRLNNGL